MIVHLLVGCALGVSLLVRYFFGKKKSEAKKIK